jgi:hypothetical protein
MIAPSSDAVSQGIERTGDGEHERVDYQKPDFIFRRPMHLGLNVLSSIFPTAAFVGTGGHERCRKCAARLLRRLEHVSAPRRNSVQTALPQMTEEEPGNEVATLGRGGFELPEFRILAGNRHHWVDDGPLLLISALRNFLIPIVIAAVN